MKTRKNKSEDLLCHYSKSDDEQVQTGSCENIKPFCLEDKVEVNDNETIDEFNLQEDEVRWFFEKDIKQAIKLLKEEFHRNWNINFQDSELKALTSHDEMCFEDTCECNELMDKFIDKIFGKGLTNG